MSKLAMSAARFAAAGICAVVLSAAAPPARAAFDDGDAPAPPPSDVAASPAPVTPAAVSSPALAIDGDRPVVRSLDGAIAVYPGARLQVDAALFPRQTPKSGPYLRRAQLHLSGWLGPLFYFDLGGDFAPAPSGAPDAVAPSVLPAADAYVAFAPLGDEVIVQAGQFDAPFTLDNRTSDAYTDFIERSMAARSVGAPRNKEIGAMVHGLVWDGAVSYAAGVFNGEGPGFRNLDNQFDGIGRVVVSPLAARADRTRPSPSIGVSAWYGNHVLGPLFPTQATPGGLRFFDPRWTTGQATPTTLELHEQGNVTSLAGEVNVPITRRLGARGEIVWKRQHLVEATAATATGAAPTPVDAAFFDGVAGYGEIWFWVIGDDELLPVPGRELPPRAGAGARARDDGLMIALRGESLRENVTSVDATLGDPERATTRVLAGTVGVNYWRGRLVRVSANYVVNKWGGTAETVVALGATGSIEQEVLLRFALSL